MIKLERPLETWAAVSPKAIAMMSTAAVAYFAADAKKDIATLATALAAKDAEIARYREALEAVASVLPKYAMKGDTASDDEVLDAVLETVTEALAGGSDASA